MLIWVRGIWAEADPAIKTSAGSARSTRSLDALRALRVITLGKGVLRDVSRNLNRDAKRNVKEKKLNDSFGGAARVAVAAFQRTVR